MHHFYHRLKSNTVAKKWALIIFWLAFVTISILMFVPGEQPKQTGFKHWDKIQHAIAFMLLIKLAWSAYPRKKYTAVIILVLFGAAVEVLQATLTTTRTGSTGDWIADVVGIMIGMSVCAFILQENRQLKPIRR
ncbi:MAG: VanZ family protein [Methylotenera sp.]|nr:VanZ family protein [Methylotenera sp.]